MSVISPPELTRLNRAMSESDMPLFTATAWITSVVTVIGPLYSGLLAVGVLPSVV